MSEYYISLKNKYFWIRQHYDMPDSFLSPAYIGFMSVHPSQIGVVLCVCDSAQAASHISTHLVPINCTVIVDVQHTFHFDLDLISDSGIPRSQKNLVFLHTLYKTGCTLCARLSLNCFTYLHILGANKLYNHCRCATYLSF